MLCFLDVMCSCDSISLNCAQINKQTNKQFCYCQEGRFVRVTDAHNLRSAMARYYDYFSKSGSAPEPVFTVPYFGFFGLGKLRRDSIGLY